MALTKHHVDMTFEFFTKFMGVNYYCFHDFDVSPEGKLLDESIANVDTFMDYLLEKQKETGVHVLWVTQNL
jgi:xylose isomerase